MLFGKNSSVDVGGLVASTANVTDDDMRNFAQGKGDLGLQIAAGREASVINAGTIKAEGGLVALHATNVENTGSSRMRAARLSSPQQRTSASQPTRRASSTSR